MQRATLNMTSMQELTKTLMRKFRKLNYKNINLLEGYEETERDYKKIRKTLIGMDNIIKSLSHYEHGNKMYKSLKEGLEYLNNKASMGIYKNTDMYEDSAAIGSVLMTLDHNSKLKNIGQKYSDIFTSISEAKKKFNSKLEEIRGKIKELKFVSKTIDYQRRKVYNLRYDLEINSRNESYSKELKSADVKEFQTQSKNAISKMKEYSENGDVTEIMKNIAREYRKHMEEIAELLKFIN